MIFNVGNSSGKRKIETVPSPASSLIYNGSAQSPTWLAYDPEQLDISGTTSATNAGTYTVAFTPTKNYKWADNSTGSKFVQWTINKTSGSLSLSASSGTIISKNNTTTFTVTRAGDGKISATSSSTSIATVSVSGTTVTVTSKGYGTATITVSVAAGTNHNAPSNKTYSVTVEARYLYKNGTEYTSFTGALKSNANEDCYLSKGSSSFSINASNGGWGTEAVAIVGYWANAIDLTNYSKLIFEGSFSQGSGHPWNGIGIWTTSSPGWTNQAASTTSLSNGVSTLDISNFNGKYYCGVWCYYNGTSVTCKSMRLE